MNNFDKLKFLLKKYDEIFNETNSLRNDNNSEKNEELIKSYDRQLLKIRSEQFVCDWESLIQVLCENWQVSPNDLNVKTSYMGSKNLKTTPLSTILANGDLLIYDTKNPEHHHFAIGRRSINRKGGKFSLTADTLNGYKVDIIFSNGVFKSIVNTLNPDILNDILVYSTTFDLFGSKFNNINQIIDMIDNPTEEQNSKNWRLFIKACDKYAEKLQSKENPETMEI